MRRALSPKNLTLCAVGVLMFLVSVPRVHQLAVQDNERDALSAIKALADEAFTPELEMSLNPVHLSASLSSRLKDVRYDSSTKVIRRHGYLFDLAQAKSGEWFARAWPVECGQTGVNAFILGPSACIMTHPNEAAEWSGVLSERPTGDEDGWTPIPPRR